MKTWFRNVAVACLVTLGALVVAPAAAFALDAPTQPSPAIQGVVNQIEQLKTVGPAVILVLQSLGTICAILTALAFCVETILDSLADLLGKSGLHGVSAQIKAVAEKILPWLKYASMYNVQKPAAPAPAVAVAQPPAEGPSS